jgi:predicted tellurium resistance membrane protein TerC
MLELLTSPQAWIALATLTALELVLGIDNIIFISILVEKLPAVARERARRIGLFMAMFLRIALLLMLSWIIGLTEPLFHIAGKGFAGRDLILIGGGLFLLWKSTAEIHETVAAEEEGADPVSMPRAIGSGFAGAIVQIMLVDLVFSLDSIITAIGMVDQVPVMIAAVISSVGLMMLASASIGRFISAHPTIKVLALAFLVAVGLLLIAEGFGNHVPKGYIYFAMAFSMAVEMLNIRMRRNQQRHTDSETATS